MEDRAFLISVFLMEAWDTLAVVEDGIARPDPPLGELRVVTHRLRGSSALHGFPRVSAEAAAMEEAVEALADLPPEARRHVVTRLGENVARLQRLFDAIGATGREDLDELAADPPVAAASVTEATNRFFAENPDVLAYFGPEAAEHLDAMTRALLALERDGGDDAELATLFRAVHTLKGAAYTVGCRVVGDVAHRVEDLLMVVRDERRPVTGVIVEAALVATDALKLALQGDAEAGAVDDALARATSRLERAARDLVGAGWSQDLRTGDGAAPVTPTAAAPPPVVAADGPRDDSAIAVTAPAAAGGPTLPVAPPVRVPAPRPVEPRVTRPSIRVNLDRLDGLMSLVGELVIARSRLDRRVRELEGVGENLQFSRSQMTQTVRDFEGKYQFPQLQDSAPAPGFAELEFDRYDDFSVLARRAGEISADISEIQTQLAALIRTVRNDTAQIQRLTGELRQEITRARMVPIGRLFARFARQVREAARAAGKLVALDVSGEGVEMDNAVIEQIADPLLHLVQNAIVHGIESPEERRRRGKPEQGIVSLDAYQKSGALYVEIADDGIGIDAGAIRDVAVARGLLRAEVAVRLSDRDALDLVFVPGFSTASAVTEASGRGVGMDVVRTNISRLRGDIDLETEVGVGTRFTIKLPLTIAISDAFLVRAGGETFAIPIAAVKTVQTVRPGAIQVGDAGETIVVEGQVIDLVRLPALLGLPAAPPAAGLPVVVVRAGRRSLAVGVDALLGKEEIVIKALGEFLQGVGPFAGATISGDGRVFLLLDATRLVETAGREAPVPAPADSIEAPAEPAGPGARRVLLVDDSISIRKFVGQMLERAGFLVHTANDGACARERLADVDVDVVITDLEMPRVNGYELIRDLRRRPTTRDVPVIVLTTRAGEKHAELARQLGVRHCVTKPVDEQAFVRLVEDVAAGSMLSGAAS